jgi:transposase-like protein
VDKNGYDIFGQAVSGKIVTGEVRFDCLNCGRTVVRLPSLTSPPKPSLLLCREQCATDTSTMRTV